MAKTAYAPVASPELTDPFQTEVSAAITTARPEFASPFGQIDRELQLRSLPTEGKFGFGERIEMAYQISRIGLPVDNITRLIRKDNKGENEDTLGSMGVAAENRGHLSIHDLYYEQLPAKRAGTLTHEITHSLSPLDEENDKFYGSPEAREASAEFVRAAAGQALATDVYLNGYHAHLAEQLHKGEITRELFDEETSAIVNEMAITNRNGLLQKEASQHTALDRQNQYFDTLLGQLHRAQNRPAQRPKELAHLKSELVRLRKKGIPQEEPVHLTSKPTVGADGELSIEPAGADKMLITLMPDVNNYEELMTHIKGLKSEFYPVDARRVAAERGTATMPEGYNSARVVTFIVVDQAPDLAFTEADRRKKRKQRRG